MKIAFATVSAVLLVGCVSKRPSSETVIANQSLFEVRCLNQAQGAETLLINLHRDEWTSLAAAAQTVSDIRADLCWLDHPGGRNVYVGAGTGRARFDPNRMFTDDGLARSMRSLNTGEVPGVQVNAVRSRAVDLVRDTQLGRRRVVIALHNNSDENYSAASYLPTGMYASDADTVYLPPGADPDDFYFVTERSLFDALAGDTVAVVLQNNATVTDDGSLSVYCAQQGIRYVNVEAQHGHLDTQVAMLRRLYEVLGLADGL